LRVIGLARRVAATQQMTEEGLTFLGLVGLIAPPKIRGARCNFARKGGGVNNAPALKQADIGVSMGIRGTDVARDTSDLVLLDDNFAIIVRAIGEGRRQFANVQKFVRYLLSSNAGKVLALVVNIAIGGPLVFLATQILWMNLVTDGVTAVALGLEKSEPDQMRQRPPSQRYPGPWRQRRRDNPCFGNLYRAVEPLGILSSDGSRGRTGADYRLHWHGGF